VCAWECPEKRKIREKGKFEKKWEYPNKQKKFPGGKKGKSVVHSKENAA
jgi:hypothetical protein